jgi:hypothetical protein
MSEFLYHAVVEQSAWYASALGLTQMWVMGDRRWWGPWLGLVAQVPWFMLALYTQQWGLVPACVAYTFVHGRNARKWWRLRDAIGSQVQG